MLERLEHPPEDGSQISVKVHPLGKPDFLQLVDVKKIRIAEVMTDLRRASGGGISAGQAAQRSKSNCWPTW